VRRERNCGRDCGPVRSRSSCSLTRLAILNHEIQSAMSSPAIPPIELRFASTKPQSARRGEPVTCGLPWPRGMLTDPSALRLRDNRGHAAVLQHRVLDRWPDASVRWLLLDWQATVSADTVYTLFGHGPPGEPVGARLSVAESGAGVTIDTGTARFRVRKGSRFPFESVVVRDTEVIDAMHSGLRVADDKGNQFQPEIATLTIEERGPVRACLCLSGRLGSGSSVLADFVARLHFFAGSATVRFVLTITNPRRAAHPGGLWDLGGGGSIYMRDAAFSIALPPSFEASEARCSAEAESPFEALALPIEVYQDSSGGESWKSSNHVNRNHQVPNTFRGYRLKTGRQERSGLRATPIVELTRGSNTIAMSLPDFWQNFPKSLECEEGVLTLRLFPRQYADVHELQGGEQKTHTFYASFAREAISAQTLEWARDPLLPQASPRWYCDSGALPYLTPRSDDPNTGYLSLVDAAIDGSDTFERKREVIDEYGWRHFGEIYGDHEAVYHTGPTPLVSHYNNQYDPVAGFAYQFFRSGDTRWWKQMVELARHVIDIDIYHTDQDKSAYNHGLFWHTYHYVDADTANHRTYPKAFAKKVHGGGPADEHNYSTGLMLLYFLTGDAAARNAAVDLGRWVIDMDDGRKTIFRWLDTGATGFASKSRSEDYHGPGRGSANSVSVLLNAHRLTGEQRFLDKAEEIIRRVIHPTDDVVARNLLDAENRWFYVMFMQSLGRYLDYKAEIGQVDERYAYGREALLHYARWMLENEYPYLDKPEILEYPTETWAAQDMRKSDVFKFAALHSEGLERVQFILRGDYFFHYSVKKLSEMPTRTLARPVIVLLSCGYNQSWFRKYPTATAPQPAVRVTDFGKPTVFVPQKARAKKKLVPIAAAGALAALVVVAAGLYWVWH
jgi:hypothetical protein